MLTFPNIDPVIFEIGFLSIRWYSLAYIVGIVGGWWYIGWLDRLSPPPLLTKDQRDDIIMWAMIGVILGGRVGYVLFYNAPFYISHPEAIAKIWQGGMSFHGGLLGVILSFYIFSRRQKIGFVSLMDRIACATPIGLFFGRLANFINGELYGRVTDAHIGMIFPNGGDLPRHPSQLYEAALEGLLLFIILWIAVKYKAALLRTGLCSGIFLIGYGCSRFIIEYFRQPDAHLGFIAFELSMGQLLCIPMILLGSWLIINGYRSKENITIL